MEQIDQKLFPVQMKSVEKVYKTDGVSLSAAK